MFYDFCITDNQKIVYKALIELLFKNLIILVFRVQNFQKYFYILKKKGFLIMSNILAMRIQLFFRFNYF